MNENMELKLTKSKPSEYAQNLLDAIRWAKKNKHRFKVNFGTFGDIYYIDDDIDDYGKRIPSSNFPTLCVQILLGRLFTVDEIISRDERAYVLGVRNKPFNFYEKVINELSYGNIKYFLDMVSPGLDKEIKNEIINMYEDRWSVATCVWEEAISEIQLERFINHLLKIGL